MMEELTGVEVDSQEYHCLVLELFEPLIQEILVPSHVCSCLLTFFSDKGTQRTIQRKERKSSSEAVSYLLTELKKSPNPGWYQAFLEALVENDFSLLCGHLNGVQEIKSSKCFINLINLFSHQLLDIVNPDEITPYLLETGTINLRDKQEINAEMVKDGGDKRNAMTLLLERITKRKNDWFPDFMSALKTGPQAYQELAREIEPQMAKANPGTEYATAEGIQLLNERAHGMCVTEENMSPSQSAAESTSTDMQNGDLDQTATKANDTDQTSPLLCTTEVASTSTTRSDELNNFATSLTDKEPQDKTVLNIPVQCSDNHEGIPSDHEDGQSECVSAEDDTLVPQDTGHEQLALRSYQMELADPALKGENVIIVAPTGSGKTHVALYITKCHLEGLADESQKGKVVFFVPTVELVEQQSNMYRRYLDQYQIVNMSGDVQDNEKLPLSELVERYDIIFMTPQIMIDNMARGSMQSLRSFTLMIFDECHHTNKGHPYNNIMASYIEEKYSETISYLMPQVIGLTASVGVGKARDKLGAKNHILSLCANMDALYGITTVEGNKEELERHVNRPNEDKIITRGRTEDPFRRQINDIMSQIERKMRQISADTDIPEVAGFNELLQSPSTRGGDPYVQWISRLHKPVARIYDQIIRRPLVACKGHLKIYNLALMINEDCRTKDAVDYVVKEFKEIGDQHKDNTDHWLEKLFNSQRNFMEGICSDSRYANPKLLKLEKAVLTKYEQNRDMRAIIFCKTRDMTMALENWMNAEQGLKRLNPQRIVGGNAPAERGGMTLNKQEDVLKYFKEGKHKVLIATSVAEEGLDVSKCNLVIRYEYVTNEIAMVQSRGRGRAEDSDYYVMGDASRGTAKKEEMNKIRENMMNEAIILVRQMSPDELRHNISQIQKEARDERKMTEAGKQGQAATRSRGRTDDWELRCIKCTELCCLAGDIRQIQQSHHVILDDTINERVVIEPHPNPKNYGDFKKTDKIFCHKCRYDWGIRAIYKGSRFCVIKIDSFVITNLMNGVRDTCKKWKNAPFPVSSLTPEELSAFVGNVSLPDVE